MIDVEDIINIINEYNDTYYNFSDVKNMEEIIQYYCNIIINRIEELKELPRNLQQLTFGDWINKPIETKK